MTAGPELLPCAWPRAPVSHYICEIGAAVTLLGGEIEALEWPHLDNGRAAGAPFLCADRFLPATVSFQGRGRASPKVVVSSQT